MGITLGLVANIYNEANALPGWLDTHLPFFDDVRVLHAGPGGQYSNDGTIEILENLHIPVEFCAIDEGFGVVRTKAIRMSSCDYVMILDADERFFPIHRVMVCRGIPTPHSEVDRILQAYDFRDLATKSIDWDLISTLGSELRVEPKEEYNQGNLLRQILNRGPYDAIMTTRRHWHDMDFNKPTQNWFLDPDYQLRILRNDESIRYDPDVRMHERLIGAENVNRHSMLFFDHFHFYFKKMEMEQRAHDVNTYDRIHRGEKPLTWEEFKEGKR